MSPTLLHIQPVDSADPNLRRYVLSGIIDVDAIPALEPLYGFPDGIRVELDFAAVQRVNSMGLAQLLKLFEHWQAKRIDIRVENANRMTAMLFKMTGLDRFLGASGAKSAPAATPPAPAERIRVRLRGILDIDAIATLEPLYKLPDGAEVELDFAEVQRINSMGLAQLLKLFEHWQARGIGIRASHVGRMTAMLFKMTGLERFLVPEAAAQPALAVNSGLSLDGPAAPAKPSAYAKPVVSTGPRAMVPPATAPVAATGGQALNWQVHMQSNQQLNGWYFLNTHLQRRLGLAAHLDIADDLLADRGKAPAPAELVFIKPFDAVRLITRQGYRPLARPSDQSDEVTLLARADDGRATLAEFAGCKVAAATPDTFVYLLGRYLLDEHGLDSGAMRYQFPGHEIKAVQMLLKGEADLLFMHGENYRRLSGMTRRMVRALDHSEAGFAFHLWCLSPRRAELAEPLRDFLIGMNHDEEGRKLLAELGYAEWVEPIPEDIDMLERIYTLYGGGD
ncbi:ABC-type phosphate/phosphonate transport system, substrate-binding protein [Methylomagnum ishizawai]|uniref:ABC-type phosphate/phosphonate transport system, substrate-binding protein n=1 Tax=Methylomagnum ishizawai TaxID=1760988 RepID=A0A1Y6CTR3_9GAMM|nr:PhnD/SsuA/transferrin family substrate-binding protein [Methylomagnum ishizawai]SMF93677.1 ABC-type phosphate/phosphonate transport system, substrate-binding protein [Methylomagnum ishizawai]